MGNGLEANQETANGVCMACGGECDDEELICFACQQGAQPDDDDDLETD